MPNHTYSVTEIAGSSEISHANAIDRAVERAAKTLRHLAWVEVKTGAVKSRTAKSSITR